MDANRDLLELVAIELASCRLPFVLGGDWNMAPRELAESGMPARLRAAIVATTEPTYAAWVCESTLDFFLASESVRPAVLLVATVEDSEVRKHQPVKLVLSGRPREEKVLCLARPPARPAMRPATCCPDPARALRDFSLREPPCWGSVSEDVWQEQLDDMQVTVDGFVLNATLSIDRMEQSVNRTLEDMRAGSTVNVQPGV